MNAEIPLDAVAYVWQRPTTPAQARAMLMSMAVTAERDESKRWPTSRTKGSNDDARF